MEFDYMPPITGDNQAVCAEDTLKILCCVSELTRDQFTALRQYYNDERRTFQLSRYHGGIAIPIDNIGLSTHESVVRAVNKLKRSSEKSAEEFADEAFPDCINQGNAVRQTVKLAYLIDPASQDDYPNGFRFQNEPVYPVKWQLEQRFSDFFIAAFPVDTKDVWTASRKHTSLQAWKLRRRLKITFVPTNDLAQHLVYNPKTKALSVFHQVEWLKAQIKHTKDRDIEEGPEKSLAAGTLPPQLLVETLYTVYAILFPIGTNKKALKLAKRLVHSDKSNHAKSAFDPNLLVYDLSVRPLPANFKYVYWSRRLKALEILVKTPPPRNRIVSWFERHTSERNALTVAICGLFLSVILGFLSVLVGCMQIVVSTWAWKYPVRSTNG